MDELTPRNPNSIQQMFGTISEKYDLANSVLSFGIHHHWKKKLIKKSLVKKGNQVLDCATGTGDLAFLFEAQVGHSGSVTGTDFCNPMLNVAKNKARVRRSRCHFEWGDVTQLRYPDEKFDCASISFGIRNVKNPVQGLSELGRVVKPGGNVMILEFGQPKSKLFGAVYQFYSNQILPRVGGWISGKPDAYKYLQTSSAAFPCGDEFLALAEQTGRFKKVESFSLFWGIAYLYRLERR